MANDELYLVTKDEMTAIADAVRERTGSTESIAFENLGASIREDIVPILQEKTVSPSTSAQSVTPDSGYDGLSKVNVNAMPAAEQATPSISVSSGGLITTSATQSAGYVSAGTKSATKQLTTQAAKTVTPSTSEQTAVASGVYTTGAVKVGAIPSNYEDVTAETNAYTTKLAALETQLNALNSELDGKAAGGGEASIETCTVTVTSFANNIIRANYSSFEDGEYKYNELIYEPSVNQITLNNVLIGSLVHIGSSYHYCGWIYDNENFVHIVNGWSSFECAPISDANIEIIDDD